MKSAQSGSRQPLALFISGDVDRRLTPFVFLSLEPMACNYSLLLFTRPALFTPAETTEERKTGEKKSDKGGLAESQGTTNGIGERQSRSGHAPLWSWRWEEQAAQFNQHPPHQPAQNVHVPQRRIKGGGGSDQSRVSARLLDLKLKKKTKTSRFFGEFTVDPEATI